MMDETQDRDPDKVSNLANMTFVGDPGHHTRPLEKSITRIWMFFEWKKNRVYNKAQLIDIIFKESSYVCMYFYNQNSG
jgi:hypothetical protein